MSAKDFCPAYIRMSCGIKPTTPTRFSGRVKTSWRMCCSRLGALASVVALFPAIAGSMLLVRRSPPVFAYLVASLAITLVYPTGGAPRMLLPVVPVLIATFYLGFEWLLGDKPARGWLACALAGNMFLCTAQADLQARNPYDGPSAADVIVIIREDVPRMTSAKDLVVSDYYVAVQALADRSAVLPSAFSGNDIPAAGTFVLEVGSACRAP